MSQLAIDLQGISKIYPGGVEALRDVVMQVQAGEIFGLLGPNGAGKSTLVKILLTIVRPTRCAGRLLDRPIGHRETLQKVGYLPEQARFPEYLTALQVLDLIGGLGRVPGPKRKQRGLQLLEMVGLKGWERKPLRTFSKGMKQRLGLAQALISKPSLVFLDEPTDGLDPVGRREVADVLRELRRRGTTVFLNSHLLGEAERLCDRVAILSRGEIVRQGTVEELTREGRSYEVHAEGALPELPSVRELVDALDGTIVFDAGKGATVISLPTTRPQLMQPVVDELRRFGITIGAILPLRQSLEDYFIGVVGSGQAVLPHAIVPTADAITRHAPRSPGDAPTSNP
ncbi:MAG: ABC transporter ATP-binding protein [Verrucomicrobiales bacterium]